LAFANLNEAAKVLEQRPKAVAAYLDQRFQSDPDNDRVIALRIVAHYDAGDYAACMQAMAQARASGHYIRVLALKYPRLRTMLEQEREAKHLSRHPAE
jgi:hypothetical protein